MYIHSNHGKDCPFCKPCPQSPWAQSQCVLNKPLWMVIPPGGIHLDCPVHPDGHHVFGPEITYSMAFCELDSTRPYGRTS